MKAVQFLLLFSIILIFNSCKKGPGEGGDATITGTVFVEEWNSTFNIHTTSLDRYGEDVDVYIVYGDGPGYDDRTRTDYNGAYSFKYLRKGSYKIYVYSKAPTSTSPSGITEVLVEVNISNKKETFDAGKLTIKD